MWDKRPHLQHSRSRMRCSDNSGDVLRTRESEPEGISEIPWSNKGGTEQFHLPKCPWSKVAKRDFFPIFSFGNHRKNYHFPGLIGFSLTLLPPEPSHSSSPRLWELSLSSEMMLTHNMKHSLHNLDWKKSMRTALKLFPTPTLRTDSFDKTMKYCQTHLQVCIAVERFGWKNIQQQCTVL